ncbi:MAG TPA: 5-(carboxyamino)imidazole ribonucleotide synthase [Gemmatimonadales bacterium]|nr:5-(carboxyamino)imidazole ribonucleotide synthase [Gemmatimonadales bacterium]
MILPGAWLGVVGGGQLGRMFTIRAREMGYHVAVLDPQPASPAGAVADRQIEAAYDDPAALAELARQCAAVTVEFENVPAHALDLLAERVPVRPAAAAVAITQHRLSEKEFIRAHGFATAEFVPLRGSGDVEPAFAAIGAPALLKTSRLGYDGKGQTPVDTLADAVAAFDRFGRVECLLERRLTLELELSVVLARGADGEIRAFPPGENCHRRGILDTTLVPARVPDALAREAEAAAAGVARALDYVGVLGVELFVADRGRIFVNEIAPRPHNSGHFTLDACITDQFEQQVRALAGLPLGDPGLLTPVCMVNVLGDLWSCGPPHWDAALALPGVKLHLYGKTTPRPGRKMGHLNCIAPAPDEALALARRAHAALTSAHPEDD